MDKSFLLNQIFTPSAPINSPEFFRGRQAQVEKLVGAINERGAHAILFGERGVGKTSIANLTPYWISNVFTSNVTCAKRETFRDIWLRSIKKLIESKNTDGRSLNDECRRSLVDIESWLISKEKLEAGELADFLLKLKERCLFIFDEYDNIESNGVKQSFAILLKLLSDNSPNVTVALVGIAETIEELIGHHDSLQRCLHQIKLQRMTEEESSEIVQSGLARLEIQIKPQVVRKIVEFSSGFPHYVHLLCKQGAVELIKNSRQDFNDAYLMIAIKKGIENSHQSIRDAFAKAVKMTTASASNKWLEVLSACAHCQTDEFGFFYERAVLSYISKSGLKKGLSINYNLRKLLEDERGKVLVKTGRGASSRYRFSNPMLKAYIKLKIAAV